MKHTVSCEAFRQIQGQAYGCTCSKPPAAAGPEPMPEGWTCDGKGIMSPVGGSAYLYLDELRALLATQGLAIVPVASVVTPEDKRVLETCAAAEHRLLCLLTDADSRGFLRNVAAAELARRAAKADDAEKSRREAGDW